MRAIVLDEFGGPEVLQLRDLPVPNPGPGQVRVAVHATSVNPVDTGNRRDGSWAGLQPPVILGYDVSGVIDAVGPGVEEWQPGDEVFYLIDVRFHPNGSYAEYHVTDASLIARKPESLSHLEAAALPLAGGTAYEAVVRRLAVQQGEWLLIQGAAGGVGSVAVQLAAARGARVIAVASAQNHDLLFTPGATACIDYATEDVVERAQSIAGGKIDAMIDLVGKQTLSQSLPAIRNGGRIAAIATISPLSMEDLDPFFDSNMTLYGILIWSERARLDALRECVAKGIVCPIVDTVLPLEEVAQAHHRVMSRHGRGKVILQVRP